MNTNTQIEKITALACLALLLAGCQTVSSTHIETIGCPQLAATDPGQVQILPTAPSCWHRQVGEVLVEHSSKKVDAATIEAALRKRAAKLGADAVVVVYDHTQPLATPRRVVVGIAIKYL